MSAPPKACPYVAREFLQEGCRAWRQNDCRLIFGRDGSSIFERQLIDAAPLMYRSLLELGKAHGRGIQRLLQMRPNSWNYAQQIA